jgi:hypothetical protein
MDLIFKSIMVNEIDVGNRKFGMSVVLPDVHGSLPNGCICFGRHTNHKKGHQKKHKKS